VLLVLYGKTNTFFLTLPESYLVKRLSEANYPYSKKRNEPTATKPPGMPKMPIKNPDLPPGYQQNMSPAQTKRKKEAKKD
jgi:hypothetical protein